MNLNEDIYSVCILLRQHLDIQYIGGYDANVHAGKVSIPYAYLNKYWHKFKKKSI